MHENLPHAFCVSSDPERWLITTVPPSFHRFAAAVAALKNVEPASLRALAAEHGVEILGPANVLA